MGGTPQLPPLSKGYAGKSKGMRVRTGATRGTAPWYARPFWEQSRAIEPQSAGMKGG